MWTPDRAYPFCTVRAFRARENSYHQIKNAKNIRNTAKQIQISRESKIRKRFHYTSPLLSALV